MPVTVVILMLTSHWSHALRSLLHFNHCSRFLCHAYLALQIHLVIESGILIRFFCVFSRHIEFFGNLQWGKQQCNGYICFLADASPSALGVEHWCLQVEQDFSQVLAGWARLFSGACRLSKTLLRCLQVEQDSSQIWGNTCLICIALMKFSSSSSSLVIIALISGNDAIKPKLETSLWSIERGLFSR